MRSRLALVVALLIVTPDLARGQSAISPDAYTPITPSERVGWVVRGNVGPRSLGVGVWVGAWQTAFNTPEEWGQTWKGFGKRYGQREVHIAMSNSIEASLGALWGEEPRYVRSSDRGIWPRALHAVKSSVLTRRAEGEFAPAWGRYVGNVSSNIIDNAWLPPSATTGGATTVRIVNGVLGRMVGNVFEEFWPDVRDRLRR